MPGLRSRLSATRFSISALIVLLPLAALVVRASRSASPASGASLTDARVARGLAGQLRAVLRGRPGQRRLRPARRLGADALRFPRPQASRRGGRPAFRAADRGRRHRAGRALRPERLDRQPLSRCSASRSPTRRSASSWRWSSSACRSWSEPCSRCIEEIDREIEEAAATLGAARTADRVDAWSCRRSCPRC